MVYSHLWQLVGIWQLLPKNRQCSGCDRQRPIEVSSDIDGTTDAQFDTYRNLRRREIAVRRGGPRARWRRTKQDRIPGGVAMARGNVEVKKVDAVFEELDRMHQAIRQRAYDLFRNGGTPWGTALRDWLTAEQELVSKRQSKCGKRTISSKCWSPCQELTQRM